MRRHLVPLSVLLSLVSPVRAGAARAQDAPRDVALVTRGAEASGAAEAFASFVGLPADRRYTEAPAPTPDDVELLVTIDTDAPSVRVWRRSDGAVLERRIAGSPTDPYALALMASELLEVARTGADPASVGATVSTSSDADDPTTDRDAPAEPATLREAADEDGRIEPALATTVGAWVEGWFSSDGGAPWLVQPGLAVDL
ncbi:MAG TPA: hypothetical protein RMH99_14590, partial [Sandaracinaceae bacterium LLY-WYZ-13_1]|nr:hypothetical protein [Sandaracinaceae bacterium LLY-WYZ-13_1]